MREIPVYEFYKILEKNEKPIVVVCYLPAECCPRSFEMLKIVTEVSEKRNDFDFFSMRGTECIDYINEFYISDAPTTNIFHEGESLVKIEGLILQTKFIQKLDEFLAGIKK